MGRTEIPQTHMRLALYPCQKAFRDTRLADAGLAREQDHPSLAQLGLLPTAEQKLDLLLAANERGQRGCVQRLEPADASGLAPHLPRLDWLRQTLDLDRPERAAVEHASHKPPCAGCDHDLTWRGHRLEPRCQVGSLADGDPLATVVSSDLLPDHNEPRGNADPGFQRGSGAGLETIDCGNRRETRLDRPLRVVLVRLGITEINEHA